MLGFAALGFLGVMALSVKSAQAKTVLPQYKGPRYIDEKTLRMIIDQVKPSVGLPYTTDAIISVCKVESGSFNKINSRFDTQAYRYEPHLGTASYGVMQVLATTAKDMGLKGDAGQMFDPFISVRIGMLYLKWCRDFLISTKNNPRVKVGNSYYPGLGRDPTVAEVLMAYNGGVGTLLRFKQGTTATRQYVSKYQVALANVKAAQGVA